jgi:hypothetical protein
VIQPKHGRVLVLDSLDWLKTRYNDFLFILKMLANPYVHHANFSIKVNIYKLTSHFFIFKTGLTGTTLKNEVFIPPIKIQQ